jgi:hypothetical protein
MIVKFLKLLYGLTDRGFVQEVHGRRMQKAKTDGDWCAINWAGRVEIMYDRLWWYRYHVLTSI